MIFAREDTRFQLLLGSQIIQKERYTLTLLKIKEDVPKNSTIVCVLTGNGLKDPDCAIKNNDSIFHTGVEADISSITKIMGF